MTAAQDIAMKIKTTPSARNYAHRPRGAVLVMAIAALLAALLPNAAQAHHPVSGGVGGAQTINLSPDGYPHPENDDPGEPYHFLGRDYTVTGTGFALGPVLIFQCPVTRTAPVTDECEPLPVVGPPAVATLTGTFNAVVHMDDRFTSQKYPNGACYGPDFGTGTLIHSVQCSVLALNFDQTGTAHMAEHYVCFTGMFIGPGGTDTKCVYPEP